MPIATRGHARALRDWWRGPTAPLVAIAAMKLALHMATNGVYGFQRDEMYYIASGQHPALGYVDYPPVTPMLARLDTTLFGISPWTLRLLPAIAGALLVLLTGLCAREMGGSRAVQALAAFVALLCPLLLGANWLFQTVTFDQLTWLVAMYLVLRLLHSGRSVLWVLLGLDLGIGLETKLTIIALCAGIAVAVLTSRELRSRLRTRWPWIGLAVAAVIAAPNFAWQAANGFPTLTYINNHSADIAHSGGIATFLGQFLLYMGPLLLPLWIGGLVFLLRNRDLRPMAVITVIAIVLLLPEGKAYYPAPTILLVLAAGSVAIGRLTSARRRWRISTAVVVAGLVETALLIRIGLPIVPQASLHATGLDKLRQDFADTVGWPELTAQVGSVYQDLPVAQRGNAVILADNYGEAGAIDIYGKSRGLPEALSPHLSFWYWKPPHVSATTVVTVGYDPAALAFLCGTVTTAGHVVIPDSVTNQEQGTPILVCTNLRESVDQAWPALKSFE
jgi:4-amino-4-deoxy-L-arabinose transferase-like glycosyltransferase